MLKTDRIIVVDLEATCWETKLEKPENEIQEIIEIGICNLMLETGEITHKRSIYVKPSQSGISAFCTQLTGITPQLVEEEGVSFEAACQLIEAEYTPQGYVWCSYGEFDRDLLQKQCSHRGVAYPFGRTHLNVKSLFALKMRLKRATGMSGALKAMNEPLEGRHHSGGDDAYNIAKIVRYILKA